MVSESFNETYLVAICDTVKRANNKGHMTPYTPHLGDQQELLVSMGVAGITGGYGANRD